MKIPPPPAPPWLLIPFSPDPCFSGELILPTDLLFVISQWYAMTMLTHLEPAGEMKNINREVSMLQHI